MATNPMTRNAMTRNATSSALGLALVAATFLGAAVVQAESEPCPIENTPAVGDSARCRVFGTSGDLMVDVNLEGGLGPSARFSRNNITDLSSQASALYDFEADEFVPFAFGSATQDPDAGTVEVVFWDATASLRFTTTWTLQEDAARGEAGFERHIELLEWNGVPAGAHRLYVLTNFDLGTFRDDDRIEADADGTVRTITGDVVGSVRPDPLSPPDAYQIASDFELTLDILTFRQPLPLSGGSSLQGPANFESGYRWDFDLGASERFETSFTTTVPEPTVLGLGAAALTTLIAMHSTRARRRTHT